MNATKYVDIFIVSANITRRRPSPMASLDNSPAFDSAVRPSGTTNVTENTALNSGSSQHGNASPGVGGFQLCDRERLLGAVVVGERRLGRSRRAGR